MSESLIDARYPSSLPAQVIVRVEHAESGGVLVCDRPFVTVRFAPREHWTFFRLEGALLTLLRATGMHVHILRASNMELNDTPCTMARLTALEAL